MGSKKNEAKLNEARAEAWRTARAPALRRFAILTVSNLVVLALALYQRWDAGEVLILYWMDSVLVSCLIAIGVLFGGRGEIVESLVFWRRALDRVKFFFTKLGLSVVILFALACFLWPAFMWIEFLAEPSGVNLPAVAGSMRYGLLALFVGHIASILRDGFFSDGWSPGVLRSFVSGSVTIYVMFPFSFFLLLDSSFAVSEGLLVLFIGAKVFVDLMFCFNEGWPRS